MQFLFLILIGLGAGTLSGMFGIGGGVLIVPALMYGLGFSQKTATGTSLAILLPPIGIAAVMQYYRSGHVDFRAGLLIAASMLLGGWLGAKFALPIDPKVMKGLFGAFLVLLGAYLLFDAYRI
jgi:uncharacterized membrane protein YfcA